MNAMTDNKKLTTSKAVLLGHVLVTLPVLIIIAIITLAAYRIMKPTPGWSTILVVDAGALAGAVVGWLWWALMVPRWRDWAKCNGADEERTQLLAQRTLLIWPKGSFFEKTEIRVNRLD